MTPPFNLYCNFFWHRRYNIREKFLLNVNLIKYNVWNNFRNQTIGKTFT